jgi:LuxR family maltose regulon positive regulatory protein
MLQTVASEGRAAIELIERVASIAPQPWLERLRRAPTGAGETTPHYIDLVDPLTDRELDVLRYLPSRLTMREIADELFVSVNTLKYHLRMIYRKLGVTSRSEAAERARRLTPAPRHPVH